MERYGNESALLQAFSLIPPQKKKKKKEQTTANVGLGL